MARLPLHVVPPPAILPQEGLTALSEKQLKNSTLSQTTQLPRCADLSSTQHGCSGNIIPFSWLYALHLVPNSCPPQPRLHLQFQTTSCRTISSFSVSTSLLLFLDNNGALQSTPHLPKALHLTPDTVEPTALLVHHNLNTHQYLQLERALSADTKTTAKSCWYLLDINIYRYIHSYPFKKI